jgi:hypothetical protein
MRTVAVAALIMLLFLHNDQAYGQDNVASAGLAVADYRNVRVEVGDMLPDAERIGLTADRVRTRVELRLRQAGLTPTDAGRDEHLRVEVFVVGATYAWTIEFVRPVTFVINESLAGSSEASMWGGMNVGATHGNSAAVVVESLDGALDRFLNDYLRVNQR